MLNPKRSRAGSQKITQFLKMEFFLDLEYEIPGHKEVSATYILNSVLIAMSLDCYME